MLDLIGLLTKTSHVEIKLKRLLALQSILCADLIMRPDLLVGYSQITNSTNYFHLNYYYDVRIDRTRLK